MAASVTPDDFEQTILGALDAAEPWADADNVFGVVADGCVPPPRRDVAGAGDAEAARS